ncbi:hypothetical protein FEV09_18390 [Pseudanabaena catenata USMAC16]|uniref:Transposase IS701-like DDE domain-containing protein n=2 Tax=Pseudanabaena TaxID=1152 RepID=L8MUT3_9CYAN|nr:hypothetical protein [Pseudanabaena catenata]ELS31231.1 hypothetical protein Pse7429DRAFT_4136 [Pseudanabaena biceps PCC 7429]MDG3496513.1 hypothetical protein [Pseudanabaena catenata USMAC16]
MTTVPWGGVPEMEGSWAIPLCHERISSFETAAQRGAFQLRQVCRDLSVRPIATYDSEYGSAAFMNFDRGYSRRLTAASTS